MLRRYNSHLKELEKRVHARAESRRVVRFLYRDESGKLIGSSGPDGPADEVTIQFVSGRDTHFGHHQRE
jgi:hypothetical protein